MFLLIIDFFVSHLENEIFDKKINRNRMLVLAVTLHNIPEGMAVGMAFAGILKENSPVTIAGAFALSIGIAIQNFPEGAIISMPLKEISKKKAFLYGTLSGVVEPIFAFFTLMLTSIVVPLLPYFLAFAAGAMIYVVVDELIPESQNGEDSHFGIIGVTIGFLIMMVLDIVVG